MTKARVGKETPPGGTAISRPSGARDIPGAVALAFRLVWRADRRSMVTVIVLQIVGSAGLVGELLLARQIIGRVSQEDTNASRLLPIVLAIGVLLVVRGIAVSAASELRAPISERVRRSVSEQMVRAACAADLEAFDSADFHDQLQRARSDVDNRAWAAVWGVVALIQAVMSVAGVSIVLLALSPILVPLAALGAVPLLVAAARNSRTLYQLAYDYTTADRERIYLEGVLTGKEEAKEVRVFRLDRFLLPRFDRLWDEHVERIVSVARARLRRAVIANALNSAIIVVCLLVLVWLSTSGRLDIADLAVAVLALRQAAASLRSITTNLEALQEASLFFQDYVRFIERAARAHPGEDELVDVPPFLGLELRGVCFTYPGTDRVVLQDIDLKLEPGKIVALVGENGSGKTTLAKLVCGLYRPTHGQILLSGTPLGALSQKALHAQVAPIFQDFVRYELSVRDNIVMGDAAHATDDERLREAVAAAGCAPMVDALRHGYDTRLSRAYDDGGELSIGQWQRIAIARAFFRDAPLLVLDEPTAALDSLAEHELFQRLRELGAGRAVLLISHRFSSVRSADEIVVLDSGRVIGRGTHVELMGQQGSYANMFALQAAPYL